MFADEDRIWKPAVDRDFGICGSEMPRLPAETEARGSWRECWLAWQTSFARYDKEMVRRFHLWWRNLEAFLAANLPSSLARFEPPVNDEVLDTASTYLGCDLPPVVRLLYRFQGGQKDPPLDSAQALTNGVPGGYYFYDRFTFMYLCTLSRGVQETRALMDTMTQDLFHGPTRFVVSVNSLGRKRVHAVDFLTGNVSVLASQMSTFISSHVQSSRGDGLLIWLEEHLRRLQTGTFRVEDVPTEERVGNAQPRAPKMISLFLRRPALLRESGRWYDGQLTERISDDGISVAASVVFCPEMCSLHETDGRNYFFAYSIQFQLSESSAQGVQLQRRHWRISKSPHDPDVEAVDGEGVIGRYPILLPGARPYTYQSCITAEQFGGEMGGWFDFVPEGTREYSSDRRHLQAHVEPFSTQLPSFIY